MVLKILDASKKTLEKFEEKFDWSRGNTASGYGSQAEPVDEGVLTLDDPKEDTAKLEPEKNEGTEEKPKQVFSFDDVSFD